MEQHAIPQNVSSYQFKLVGDMTLKQFFQVAGGVLLAIILWSTPLLTIIKWPLAILSILLGVGLAFLPLEERPLEKWIFSFFTAIYSPTIFTWKKGSFSARIFQEEVAAATSTQDDTALKDYLAKSHTAPTAPANLDKAETNFFARLTALIGGSTSTPTVAMAPPAPNQVLQPAPNMQQTAPQVLPTPIQTQQIIQPITSLAPEPATEPIPTPQNKGLQVPVSEPIRINSINQTQITENGNLYQNTASPAKPATVQPIIMGNDIISAKQALFSNDAAPPNPPSTPNVVVGQVIDQDRKIVEGVIMEIKDSQGRPIRALRSNKLGHFITVTQLDAGQYEIITEKDGYEFLPISFIADGSIIPPILVEGKRLGPPVDDMPAIPVKPLYSIN
jgi:hypothetical protein